MTENIQCACAKFSWKRQDLRVWSTSTLTVFCQKSTLVNPRRVLPSFKLFFDFIIITKTCRQVLHWQCSGRLDTHRGSLSAAWLSASTLLSLYVSKEPGFRIFPADLHAHNHPAAGLLSKDAEFLPWCQKHFEFLSKHISAYIYIYTYIKPTYIFKLNYFNVCRSSLEVLGLAFIFCERKEGNCYKTISKKHSVVCSWIPKQCEIGL